MSGKAHAYASLDGQRYHLTRTRVHLPAALIAKLKATETELIPITAVNWTGSSFDGRDFDNLCRRFEQLDDVWCDSFRDGIFVLLPSKERCDIRCDYAVAIDNARRKLPQGPLLIQRSTGLIMKVSKLVKDSNRAFFSAIAPTPTPRAAFHELPQHHGVVEVALPSRLYFTATKKTPFSGLRLGVKDTIALKGLKTGFGNSAWREHHAPEKFTAPCVQRFLEAGAVVIGKLITSDFAEGVEPTEWEEGICPFNPRGDGMQKPSSSSTGSAAATAAYSWLDVAFGTDTGGSIRHPAGVNGLYGQRPTQGIVDMTGVLGATDLFNTVGIFTRSAQLFSSIGSYLLSDHRILKQLKSRAKVGKLNLLCPTRSLASQQGWLPHPESEPATWTAAEKMIDACIQQIEAEFQCTRIPFNIHDLWAVLPPVGQARSLDTATGQIYGDITTSSACATAIDKFVAVYKDKHRGQAPKMSDVVRRRFEYGRTLPDDKIIAAMEAADAFRSWINTTLFSSYDQDAMTILVFPQSLGTPDYRDDPSRWNGKLFIETFSVYAFGYLCGCPDYTIPIGELPYTSHITDGVEYLPVSLSLVGKPGCDLELFDIVNRLYSQGIIGNVAAGSRMFPDHTLDAKAPLAN